MRIIHFAADGWYARDDGSARESVIRLADATGMLWASISPGSTVCVGYDTRSHAADLAMLAGQVVASHGLRVLVSDQFCPSAALSRSVDLDETCCGGLMLTGGHRPAGNMGVRVLSSNGGPSDEIDIETIEALVPASATDQRGQVSSVDIMSDYLQELGTHVDVDLIAGSGLKVVCDPMYGSTRGHLAGLLSSLGLDVREVHGEGIKDFDGIHPEVCEPWADDCEHEVRVSHADAGLLLEGCGDRFGVVDEKGELISPHRMVSLVLAHLVEGRGMEGRVVIPQSASVLVRRQAERLGCEVVTTPEGFRWLHDEAVHGGVLMGADERGGVSIPDFGPGRDGMLVALLMVECMARTNSSVRELVSDLEDKIGHMDYGHRDVKLDAATVQTLRNMLPGVNPHEIMGRVPCEVNHMDGVRLGFDDDSWLLVRPSRTESIVRVSAEAPSAELRDELLDAGTLLARGEY